MSSVFDHIITETVTVMVEAKKAARLESERERQNTVAAKQRAEAKVEKLEDLVEAIAARCRLTHPNSVLPLADRVQDLIENHRASQRTL